MLLINIFIFIFGTFLGSFLNVCIYRLPRNISIIKPRSFCPHCNNTIYFYDNIPIISFLILRAKCRYCNKKISFRYPLVEFISGIVLLFLYLKFGIGLDFFKYLFLFYFLIVVSFIDIDFHAIPNYLCFLGILIGIIFSIFETANFLSHNFYFNFWKLPIVRDIKNLIFGFGFVYLFKFFGDSFLEIYLSFSKKDSIEGERESLGLGDVDFMGLVGLFLGIESVILVFFIAPFFAVVYGIFAIIFKRSHLIPYLPYLSLAVVVVFFYKTQILSLLRLYIGG